MLTQTEQYTRLGVDILRFIDAKHTAYDVRKERYTRQVCYKNNNTRWRSNRHARYIIYIFTLLYLN